MDKLNVLVCDDDKDIVEGISIYLKQEGYNVLKAYDGIQALEEMNKNEVHMVIIDVMMPNLDGLSATLKIREEKNVPILILSAKSEDTDKIIGLNFGADDYLTKPFNPLELMARVKSQLRRYTKLGSLEISDDVISNDGLVLDKKRKVIELEGEEIKLTATEYKIMDLLMNNMGIVFSSEQIYQRVWKEVSHNVDNAVTVHIRRIREKIEIDPKNPKYLKVVWGIGYKIEKY